MRGLKDDRETIYGLLSSCRQDELGRMKKKLVEQKRLLESYNNRPSNQLLSLNDQLNYERLTREVNNLQKEIT